MVGGASDINSIFTNIDTDSIENLGSALGHLATVGIKSLVEFLSGENVNDISAGIDSLSGSLNKLATTINGIDFTNGVSKIENVIWLLEKLAKLANFTAGTWKAGAWTPAGAVGAMSNWGDEQMAKSPSSPNFMGPPEGNEGYASGGYTGGSWSGDNRFIS